MSNCKPQAEVHCQRGKVHSKAIRTGQPHWKTRDSVYVTVKYANSSSFCNDHWQSVSQDVPDSPTGKLSATGQLRDRWVQLWNKGQLVKTVPFFIPHILYTQPEKGNSYSITMLLFSDVSSTYKRYKKNPVSIHSNRWRNWNVRLFFISSSHPPPHPPPRKRLKYLKQFTGIMYKRDGIFFLLFSFCYNMKRKNRQDEHKCVFTFKELQAALWL